MIEVRVLGSAQALRDGRALSIGGPRQRAVLVILAFRVGQRCSVQDLIDGIWGECVPGAAVKTARAYVSRLRAALGADVLVSDEGGYRLALDPAAVDATRFTDLVEVARAALAEQMPVAAEHAASQALGLWRGDAVADGAQLDGLQGAADSLAELRHVAEQLRLDAWLALGRYDAVLLAAERELARDRLREGVWERLMLALYHSGRGAEALETFTRARRVLVDGLGLEPGPGLVALQQRILRHEVPPPAAGHASGNLPAPVTSFIGREPELAKIGLLLADARLVTLLGVGGAGKTRLAIEAGRRWRAAHGAPVWFVDLAPLRDPGLVPGTVMATVGAPEMPGAGPLEACAAWLGSRRALLLLDNCEHLAGACAEAALRLLEACPRLLVLATSRTPLGVAGETVYPVPPLATPDERTPRWRPAAGYDAVRLFLERARSAGGGTRGEADLALAGELCRRLDGLPLAIEFAAARTRAMSLSEIAAGMTDRFALLAPARRAGPERHRTLRTAIDWSHDLLTSDEQVLLRRLSVFDGGFTADAAAAVCADSLTAATPDLMHHLLDASLIVPEPGGEQTRYRLFETVREYAAGRLTGPAERARAEEQHARYYCALAEHANAELQGPGEQAWLHRLDAEQDNLRAALRYSAKPAADAALLASTAIALAPFWRLRGMLKEGAGWLQAALSTADDGSVQQAALRICLGSIRYRQSEFGEAAPLLTAGIRTARARAERALVATGLRWLAGTHVRCGRLARAVPLAEEAVAIWEQLGNTVAAAWPRGMLADIAVWKGRFTEAQSLYEQGLGTLRAQGPPSMLVGYLHSMSELAYATGDLDRAEALCHEALPIAEQVGDVWHVGNLHDVLARLSRRRGNPRLAFRHGLLALERFEDLHCINEIAEAIEVLGGSAIDTGDIPHGALLLAGARQLRRASGIPLVEVALRTTTEADWETVIRLCSSTLNAIEQRAATLTLDQLIAAAKGDLANPQTR